LGFFKGSQVKSCMVHTAGWLDSSSFVVLHGKVRYSGLCVCVCVTEPCLTLSSSCESSWFPFYMLYQGRYLVRSWWPCDRVGKATNITQSAKKGIRPLTSPGTMGPDSAL
jgi:hypothetical protein